MFLFSELYFSQCLEGNSFGKQLIESVVPFWPRISKNLVNFKTRLNTRESQKFRARRNPIQVFYTVVPE